jgi:general secretion pathway protein J
MRSRFNRGFTLIELLLATSLLVLLVGSLTGGLQFGRRVWERGTQQEDVSEFNAAINAVRDQLAAAYPVAVSFDGKPPHVIFDGWVNGCRFVSLSDGTAQIGGLILTEIGAFEVGGNRSLNVWTQVFRIRDVAKVKRETMRRTQVMAQLEEISFRYFGAMNGESVPKWQETWSNSDKLPLMVAGRVTIRRKGLAHVAAFTVPIRQR